MKRKKKKAPRRKAKPSAVRLKVNPELKRVLDMANNFQKIRDFIAVNLKVDVDYGKMQDEGAPLGQDGQNNFLLKPGAEKLAKFLGVRPKFVPAREEKLSGAHLDVVGTVKLLTAKSGEEVWESAPCSCSTLEMAYRYEWVRPVCGKCAGLPNMKCEACRGHGFSIPSPEQCATLKTMDMGKWVEQKSGNITLRWNWFERKEIPNVYQKWNEVRQQSAKRAFVQAIRSFGCLSGFFKEESKEWFEKKRQEADVNPPAQPEKKPQGRIIMEKDIETQPY